ncbi:MAG: hypothetical protein LBT15_06940, partial [Synergistaceae bacterium]|nr:hypothetical protein [Synergistaceae bacterium]
MRIKKWMVLLLWLAVALSPAEAASKSGVASFVPTGQVANNVAFKVVFTEAVAPKDVIGKTLPVSEFPFTVAPAFQAEGQWLVNRTFSASLLAPLGMGTAYAVTIPGGLKNLKGKSIGGGGKYAFQTEALSLVSVHAANIYNSYDEAVSVRLEFNMPVDPSRLRGFLRFTLGRGQGSPLSFRINANRPDRVLPVTVQTGEIIEPVQLNVRVAAGLTGETGTLGLPQEALQRLEIRRALKVESMAPDGRGVRVYFNFNVDADALKNFIRVEPEIPFSIEHWYSGLFYIRGDFKPRQRFVLTLKKGLPSDKNGIVLDEDHTQAVIMPDLEPSINLPASGMFLAPIDGGRIPVELVNVKKLQVGLWRLYENNIPYVMRRGSEYFQKDLARRLYNKEFSLSLPLNETTRRALVLDEMTSGDRGLFMLTLLDPDYNEWYERSQVVNLSDMGLVARLWEDGILVWVNTLSGLQPVADANVRLYSTANQLLAEGKTDADGLWVLKRDAVWSDEEDMTPAIVTASKNDDVTFVRLTRGLMSQGIFDTGGRPWLRSGYDALLFSARGIYRPGEQAPFRAVVRTYDLGTPEPFPVLFTVYDPLGRTVKRGTELLTAEGGAVFNMDLPSGALTGIWSIGLSIPGDEEHPLARTTFSVEDFAPPRIEVKMDTDATVLIPAEETKFGLSARYLFGVDGAGLKWEAKWNARADSFVPKNPKWRPYVFGDSERPFTDADDMIEEGTLDAAG